MSGAISWFLSDLEEHKTHKIFTFMYYIAPNFFSALTARSLWWWWILLKSFTFSDFSTKFLKRVLFILFLPWVLLLRTALSSTMLTLMSWSLSITWNMGRRLKITCQQESKQEQYNSSLLHQSTSTFVAPSCTNNMLEYWGCSRQRCSKWREEWRGRRRQRCRQSLWKIRGFSSRGLMSRCPW